MEVAQKKEIMWLDTLRVLATIGVLIIHVSSPLVNMTYGKQMDFWWIGNVTNSLVRFSVPAFLMLSGITLLGRDYNLTQYFKRRIMRVLLPFLFWMLVYLIYRWLILPAASQPMSYESIGKWAVNLFLGEGISKHFWYIYMILFIYLIIPFIGGYLNKMSNSQILILIFLWVLLASFCKGIPANPYNWGGGYAHKFLGYFLHSGYLLLGYFLGRLNFSSDRIPVYSSIIFIICAAITSIVTYYISMNAHKLDLSFYGFFTINSIVQNSAFFLLVSRISIKNNVLLKIQTLISNYSLGIYFVHMIVIGLLFRNGILWTFAHPLISLPLLTVITLISSYIIIFLLRQIPFGKYVSG